MRQIIILILCFVAIDVYSQKNELDSIFSELDKAMANKSVYISEKEERIAEQKRMFSTPGLTKEQCFLINEKLYWEYAYYIPDSAKVYLFKNLDIAKELDYTKEHITYRFLLVSHYSTEGFYIDSSKVLDSIRPYAEQENLMSYYYSIYKQLYYFYSSPKEQFHPEYFNYQDSLMMVTDKNASVYPILLAEKLTDEGKGEAAREILLPLFEAAEAGSHQQAKLANNIGKTYLRDNDYEQQKKYFAIAAAADIKSVVREHESFRSLAIACYETNEVNRAYEYISQSMEDALLTNFNVRMLEASQFFPIIEKSYQRKLQAEKNRFFYLSILTGIIALLLIIGIVYIYSQMKKLAVIRRNLAETNKQLSRINEEIGLMNKNLSEANLLKETYIAQFLNVCSLYVKKIKKYQSSLNKKAMEQKVDELYRMLKSQDMIDTELKELHELFDRTFLSLYPNFIHEINKLLPESEQLSLKGKDSMTTELRIFALIRLGITDSSAIADFLHNSIKTVYNYRTRIRNKSLIDSDEFEEQIRHIDMR